MNGLLDWGENYAPFSRISDCVKQGKAPVLVQNISHVSMSHLCAFCCRTSKTALFITADEREAKHVTSDMKAFLGDQQVAFYPARDMAFYKLEGRSLEWEHMRLSVLAGIAEGTLKAVVTTIEAVQQFAFPKDRFTEASETYKEGQIISPAELCKVLTTAGYRRCDMIEGKGQFSSRGGIVDFFSPVNEYPIRVDFFGDEIDAIAPFDLVSQRRMDKISGFRIVPASEQVLSKKEIENLSEKIKKLIEKKNTDPVLSQTLRADLEQLTQTGTLPANDRYIALLRQNPSGLFDYFDAESPIFIAQFETVRERAKRVEKQLAEDIKDLLKRSRIAPEMKNVIFDYVDVIRKLSHRPLVILESLAGSLKSMAIPVKDIINMQVKGAMRFSRDTAPVFSDIKDYHARKTPCLVLCKTVERAKRLSGLAAKEGIPAYFSEQVNRAPLESEIIISSPALSSSFQYGNSLAVLCEAGAEGTVKKGRGKKKKAGGKNAILSYSDLSVGDYVVHTNYGIGVFKGVSKVSVEGVTKDYIKIKYAGADTLYVPCNQLDLVSKYISPDHRRVKLNRMGGTEWSKAKAKAKAATGKLAKQLIVLYAQRQKLKGFAFSSDGELQRDFEARFPHEETEDQLRCSEEIKRDMEKSIPMDRLLCGDVGFGKTEVALRGAFKCIVDGKQAAILVPTTLLAQQHYETVLQRMEGFAVNCAVLSRFNPPAEQRKILKELRQGKIDLVIGTHRLIQQDVIFHDLGLLIVDEEQRFGVAHKERLKEMTKDVDVLTLTATPIPRTLNMAMSGIRDMSLLEEPPKDRHPVTTYVSEWDPDTAADAVRRELRRGGQVFFLHNRVENIEKTVAVIAELVPDARVVCGHGKMREEQLSSVMSKFIGGEADVLVCTTIIETGIDIPNVNTLIIDEADRLGLAQLYQIRGRVGRSSQRAYAYLMYRRGKILSEDAVKRLVTVREFTEFGSGFKIALRDLEIRGAGNILGMEQHGHMEAVGYDMYLKLLDEAVAREKGDIKGMRRECAVDLFVDAYIPESYIESGEARIYVYKRIAALMSDEDVMDVRDELLDRFGDIPKPVLSLIDVAVMRNRASKLGFTEITQKGNKISFTMDDLPQEAVLRLTEMFRGRLRFIAGLVPAFYITRQKKEEPLEVISSVVDAVEGKDKEKILVKSK